MIGPSLGLSAADWMTAEAWSSRATIAGVEAGVRAGVGADTTLEKTEWALGHLP